jgi:adenine-specific DNA-methyltransferase
MTKFHQKLENILKKESKFLDQNGNLLKAKLIDYAFNIDEDLIKILISDPDIKTEFFKKIQDVEIFDINHFIDYIKDKNFLNHSYTAFSHKIGLTIGDKFLKSRNEISLSFPYKDCILEGGQSREESKRNEVFFNKILDKDEAKRLLDPKFLTNFEYWDEEQAKKWEEFEGSLEEKTKNIKGKKFKDFTRDKKGVIQDNLLIKGNNLIAMHTIKKQFAGKVKLIYIDPPYNTGNDGFKYNDSFNHSSWLTFMKNRLEIARELLRDDGVIFIQCSFHKFAYLRILADDIFKKHLCDFNIQVRHPDRNLTGDKEFNDVIEYILIYTNDCGKKMPIKEVLKTEDDYTTEIQIKNNAKPEIIYCDKKMVEVYRRDQYEIKNILPTKDGLKKISIRGSIREKNSSGRFFVKHLENLQYPAESLFKVPEMGDDARNYRYFYSAPEGKKNGGYYQGMPTSSSITKKQYSNFYNFEKEYNNVSSQGEVSFRNGKKPEELIKFLIEIFTNENDLVLDFFAGSGTTPAVAHKMNRRWIAIEQMNYIQDLPEARLKKVIAGEQGGISKSVKWQGGGSFVYFELATHNQKLIDEILATKNDKMLDLWQKIKKEGFLIWNIDIKKFDQNLDEFEKCTLEEKRKILMDILNMNMIYVLLGNCESDEYGFTKDEIELNKSFFQNQYIYTDR